MKVKNLVYAVIIFLCIIFCSGCDIRFENAAINDVVIETYDSTIDERLTIQIELSGDNKIALINDSEYEYELSDKEANEIEVLVKEMCSAIEEEEDSFWPNTKEYPDLPFLWSLKCNGSYMNKDFNYRESA